MTIRLVSAPIVALASAGGASLVLAVMGANPVWRSEPLNLTEAVALRDAGEVARLLLDGADPHAEGLVRAGFLNSRAAVLTPVDMAVRTDRPDIVQLLIDAGLSFDFDTWQRAWCIAASGEMRQTLGAAQPPGASGTCDGRPE